MFLPCRVGVIGAGVCLARQLRLSMVSRCAAALLGGLAVACEMAVPYNPSVGTDELKNAAILSSQREDPDVATRFGKETMETVMLPDSVEVFRLASGGSPSSERIVGQVAVPSVEWFLKLRALLGQSSSYGGGKRCGMRPGVLVRFHRGSHSVLVKLCFECNVLSIAPPGEISSIPSFDAVRAQLVRLVQEAFPDDAEIQGLTP